MPLAAILVAVAGAAPAMGATLSVNTTTDELTPGDGLCSLREAIATVDVPGAPTDCTRAGSGANTIVLGAHRYRLSISPAGADDDATGDLNIAATVTALSIKGAGERATVVDATGLGDRLLAIPAGPTVTIGNLTLTGGHAPDGTPGTPGIDSNSGDGGAGGKGGSGGFGGAIENGGTLTLTDVGVTNSRAGTGGNGGRGGNGRGGYYPGSGGAGGFGGEGGGIYNEGTLTAIGTTISGNRAGSGGGGGAGGSTGTESGAGGAGGLGEVGGGIASQGITLTLTGSTISGNGAGDGGQGGSSPAAGGPGGPGGTGGAAGTGGGGSSLFETLMITNSTIAANTAGDGGAGGNGGNSQSGGAGGHAGGGGKGGVGGGAEVYLGTNSLLNVTLAGNAAGSGGSGGSGGASPGYPSIPGAPGAPGSGGGINVDGGAVSLQNSLLASNPGGNCAGAGSVSDSGHNLSFGDTSCPGSFASGDPKLRSLQDNGGPAQTMGLGALSAAVDVPGANSGCPASDERGVHRPQGASCDIGAYEVALPFVTTGPAANLGSRSAKLTGTVTANAGAASVRFQFGRSSAYGSTAAVSPVGGVTPASASATIAHLKPATRYHYRLVASSVDGTAIGLDRTFRTSKSPPHLAALTLKPSVFHSVGKHTGTTISYRDSRVAKTTFMVRRCVKFSKHGHGCARYVKAGRFTHADRAGRNHFHFSGRIAGKALRRGSYRLDATPRANGQRGNTASAVFRID